MNENKVRQNTFPLIVDSIILLFLVSTLITGIISKQRYDYYMFIRWQVMLTYIYSAYKSFGIKQFGLIIYFLGVALLFNPIRKFTFQKEIWHLIDYIVAFITLLIVILNWLQEFKPKKHGRYGTDN